MNEITPAQLAEWFVAQVRKPDGEWPNRPDNEPHAITIWEEWICGGDPERGWPVYAEILRRNSDDETLYQVGVRIRHLLWRHYDRFIDRLRALFDEYPRLWRIMGEDALDRTTYTAPPYDREALIDTYERYQRVSGANGSLSSLIKTSPRRALPIVIEIIHRAPKHALKTFDVFDVVRDLLVISGLHVVEQLEVEARNSVLVRRAIWETLRLSRRDLLPAIAAWCETTIGNTTGYTDDLAPWPLPKTLNEQDEKLLEDWLESEKTFDAWVEVEEMIDSDPDEAWAVTRRLLERCTGTRALFSLAAGPLEDLLHKQPRKFDDIAAAARENSNVREALGGVWIFPDDEVYDRFNALLRELGDAKAE